MAIPLRIAIIALTLFITLIAATIAADSAPSPLDSDSPGSSVLTPFAAMPPEAQASLAGEDESMDDDFGDEDAAPVGAPVDASNYPPVENAGGAGAPGGSKSGASTVGGAGIVAVASVTTAAVAACFMF